ncbi:MAG: hypothetical protein CME36_08055 [unclassified Hahellaceae]|nr:hypothetical protein [Hahellaceae bacterium]|tara:strand:- start:83100 stop:84194 length:1095 start_codon:yes stop_codon:yes gene_type:complete
MSSRNITSASSKAGSPKAQGISYHAFLGTLAAAVDKAVVTEGELEGSLGLDLHSLSPSDRVPVELVQQLWERLEEVATTSDYGLIIGQYISPDTKGLLASWVSQCKSLGEALRVFVQNSVLMSQLERYSLKERDGFAIMQFEVAPGLRLPIAYRERILAAQVSWAKHLVQRPLRVEQIRCDWPRPRHWRAYDKLFGPGVMFDCESTEIAIEVAALDLPVSGSNDFLKSLLSETAREAKQRLFQTGSIREQVSLIVRHRLRVFQACPTVEEACKSLGMTRQTLYRKLLADETSYSALLDAERREFAVELARNLAVDNAALAESLGFTDTSSCSKAFKRWFGLTVWQYRQRLKMPGSELANVPSRS